MFLIEFSRKIGKRARSETDKLNFSVNFLPCAQQILLMGTDPDNPVSITELLLTVN